MKDCIVVGAGLAGLAAAHELVRRGLSVVVLEQADEPGGRARTYTVHGTKLERGAGFVANFYRGTRRLAQQAGVELRPAAFVPSRSRDTQYLLTPKGLVPHDLGTPSGLVRTQLLTPADKIRLVATLGRLLLRGAPDIAHVGELSADDDGTTAAEWARLHLGHSGAEYIARLAIEPFFYFGTEEIAATVLRSLLRHAIGWHPLMPIGGMSALTLALARHLDVRYGARVDAVLRMSGHLEMRSAKASLQGRSVIFAVPAPEIASMRNPLSEQTQRELASVEYVPSVRANFGYSHEGVLTVPAITPAGPGRRGVVGVTKIGAWDPERVSPGREVVRVSAASWRSAQLSGLPPLTIAAELRRDAADVGIPLPVPDWVDVLVSPHALVLPRPGHFSRSLHLVRQAPPDIALAGDWIAGSTLESAVRSGYAAAEKIARHLGR